MRTVIDSKDVFLVTGGTGKIGTAFVHCLASDASQPEVRVATRSVESAAASLLRAFNPETVKPVHFDVDDPQTLQQAFAGVTKLFIVAPIVEDMAAWHRKVMEAAQTAGTCRYAVKVSVTGARSPDSDPPPGRLPLAHWQGEEAIRSTGIPSTMIRPTIFMQHFLTGPTAYERGDDRLYLPTGDTPIAFLDCRDIAVLAWEIFRLPQDRQRVVEGQSFELTGPSSVSAKEIASILSWAAGREIRHIDGEDAFVEHCRTLGVPDGRKYIYAEAAHGWFSEVEIEKFVEICGRRPTSFAKFAFDHASHFAAC
jgi:uncharacterized protein YbjT (DUF2867 family)